MTYSSGGKPLPPRWERRVRFEVAAELLLATLWLGLVAVAFFAAWAVRR